MDVIRINALELACIVGVRPRERRQKQIVRIDLSLMLGLSPAGRSGRIAQTCDYSLVVDEISALLTFREYQLVEAATEELAAMLLGLHPLVEAVQIQLEKPAALGGRARSAAVCIERSRANFPVQRSATSYGERQTLLETGEAGLYLLSIAPGQTYAATDAGTRQLAWLVSGELQRAERRLRDTEPLNLDSTLAPIENQSDRLATLFVCTPRAAERTPEQPVSAE